MKKAEYLALVERELAGIKAIIQAKNNDYTAESESAFSNFESTPELATPIAGLLIRMGDKFQRLKTFSQTGKLAVKNEGAEDAFRDLIGYALIGLGMLSEAKEPGITRSSAVDADVAFIASLRAEQVQVDKPQLIVQEGKCYRRRDGVITFPVTFAEISEESDELPYQAYGRDSACLGWYYDKHGRVFPREEKPFHADLVEEVEIK